MGPLSHKAKFQGEMNSSADLGKFGFRTGLTLAQTSQFWVTADPG